MAIDREKINQAAQKFVDKKKYDKAVLEYQKLVEADPSDARTLLKIGDLQSKMTAYGEAIVTYETVGKLYAQQGFALKAIAVYKQIREIIQKHVPQLDEKYSHITPKLAELYKQLGLVSDALAALDEVATRLQSQQRDQDAINVFRKIVELDPNNPLPHLRLAEALSRTGEAEGAVTEFGFAASQLLALGRKDDAVKVLERSLHHKQDETVARQVAEIYVSRNTREDGLRALAKLQICFQTNPKNLATLALLARAFNTIGQSQKAVEVQKEMARIARDAGEEAQFRELVDRLLVLAPNDDGVKRLAVQAGLRPEDRVPTGSLETAAVQRNEQVAAPPAQRMAPPPARPPAYAAPPPPPPPPPPPAYAAPARPEPPAPKPMAGFTGSRPNAPAAPPPRPHNFGQLEEDTDEAELIDEDELEAVEVDEAPPSAPQLPSIDELLADAESFRRLGLFDRALEAIATARESAPQRVDILEAERDTLLEANRVDEAVDVMLGIAQLYADQLENDSAAQSLQDALAYEPRNARALAMLGELGYEVVDEGPALPEPEPPPARPHTVLELSDPFSDPEQEAPLPSFSLETEAQGQPSYHPPAPPAESYPPAVAQQEPLPAESFPPAPAQPSPAEISLRARAMDLDEALEEVEFYMTRGLLDDARIILSEQLGNHPNHPLLQERLAELQALEEAASGSGARERSSLEHSYDLETSLDGDLNSWIPEPMSAEPQEQVDVEEIFSAFKEGVAKQISVDDSQAHYDLGLAYKEMALHDDAIREFLVASRDVKRAPVCHAMIGGIELERGNGEAALKAFLDGLATQGLDAQQETMLTFEIGCILDSQQDYADALKYYLRTQELSPGYRDVESRISRMRGELGSIRVTAAGATEDWDAAFDGIIQKR